MYRLTIAGIGQGSLEYLSMNIFNLIKNNDHFILQSNYLEIVDYLEKNNKQYEVLNGLIKTDQSETKDNKSAEYIIKICKEHGQAILLNPGQGTNDFNGFSILEQKCKENDVDLKIVPGISLAYCAVSALCEMGYDIKQDKLHSYKVNDETGDIKIDFERTNIFMGLSSKEKAYKLKSTLIRYCSDELYTYIIDWNKTAEIKKIRLSELDKQDIYIDNTCLVVEPVPFDKLITYDMDEFMRIIEILRSPEGCPWDRVQTHESLKRSLIEECYEVLEAVELSDNEKICEELGDVMLIIAMHAQIAKENDEFTIKDIIDGIAKKIVLRHPHVFAGVVATTLDQINQNWEEIKKTEKNYKSQTDILKSVPKQFPALMRSEKVQKKAKKAGITKSADESYTEIKEKIAELEKIDVSVNKEKATELIGEILANVANISMLNKIDPEESLTKSTEKFILLFNKAEKTGKIKKLV